ncbi:primosomal protein N' [Lichenibacterium dinghuense]|uniref:primosomal protein N' n=1 Tax=Lichenibacterium dinghuense TaxID=2895977 RepID=UPI001F01D84F|nr:primosomal protein N' [Lichenibacterium sp. 6Y81]
MTEAPAQPTVVDVLIPVAVDQAYSYRVPKDIVLAPGDFVVVPLGTRQTIGVVWDARSAGGDNLKSVLSREDWPPVREPLRRFVDWLANWTLSPRGMVLRMAIRAPEFAGAEPVRVGLRRAGDAPKRMTPARLRVMTVLDSAEAPALTTRKALAEAANCSAGVIDGLVDEGTLETVALPPDPLPPPPDPDAAEVRLDPAQGLAAAELAARAAERRFTVSLLEGVTGSGKTETYFEAVAAALRSGRQTLILLPEIALTAQFLDRFAARFGVRPTEWHSGVSVRRRARAWSGIASGEIKVVAGARSSLFLPYADLGLIVVDEEHEAAYKQDDGVSYHARDMAVMRGRFEEAAVVLASATPSLETRVNAETGRYSHLKLVSRYAGRSLPSLSAVDMRRDAPPRGRWISPTLAAAMAETVADGKQALLFLNRRGYAPLTLCRSCGHRFTCGQCSAWMVDHRFRGALVCHLCGHVERKPDHCPRCGEVDALVACGPGVERIAEEVATLFPDARRLVLSSDMPGGTERLRQELDGIARGEVDVVVGTQLVAKGHNFPNLTLAAVVDADVGLANGDPRAAERTFQLLQQVTGRAGRGEAPGRALIQTYQPDHPVMRALLTGDVERFYRTEIEARQRGGLPPFGRLAGLIVSGTDRHAVEAHARALARAAHAATGGDPLARAADAAPSIEVFGPAEAPIAMIRGRYRFRLLVKAPRSADLQGFLRRILAEGPKATGSLRVAVDVEPQSFL